MLNKHKLILLILECLHQHFIIRILIPINFINLKIIDHYHKNIEGEVGAEVVVAVVIVVVINLSKVKNKMQKRKNSRNNQIKKTKI